MTLNPFIAPLAAFLEDVRHADWLEAVEVRFYVRKAIRGFGTAIPHATLELANVQVGDGRRENTGKLRLLLLAMEAQTARDWLYVENADNPRMAVILERHGWTRLPNPGVPDTISRCYYKRLR